MIFSVLCIAFARDVAHAQQMPAEEFYERAAARAASIFGKGDNGWAAFEAAIVGYAEYQERIDEPIRENEDLEYWLDTQLDALRFGEYPRPGLDPAIRFLRAEETRRYLSQVDDAMNRDVLYKPWDTAVSVYKSFGGSIVFGGLARRSLRASCALIRLDAIEKQTPKVIEHARRCLLLARAMSSQGLLIDRMTAIAFELPLYRELRMLVIENELNEDMLRGLLEVLRDTPAMCPLEAALETERDFCLATMLESSKENGIKARPKQDAKFIEATYSASLELARDPRRSRASNESLMDIMMRGAAGIKNRRQANHALVSSFRLALDSDRTVRLERAATRAMLLIGLHRAQTGQWPQTAEGLDLPDDPIANRPFVYRRTPDAEAPFILYSVGSDGIDHGGQEKPGDTWDRPTPDDEGFDFVVSKPRLPYTPSDSLFPSMPPSNEDAPEDDPGE